MSSILNQIYYGKILPAEQILPRDPDYMPTQRKICKELEYLTQTLSPENAKRLDEMSSLFGSSSAMVSYAAFSYGFKLGVQLMVESFAQDGKIPRNNV